MNKHQALIIRVLQDFVHPPLAADRFGVPPDQNTPYKSEQASRTENYIAAIEWVKAQDA